MDDSRKDQDPCRVLVLSDPIDMVGCQKCSDLPVDEVLLVSLDQDRELVPFVVVASHGDSLDESRMLGEIEDGLRITILVDIDIDDIVHDGFVE